MPRRFTDIFVLFHRKVFLLFGGPPQRYWGALVLFFFAIFLGVLLFDAFVYFRVTKEQPRASLSQSERLIALDEKTLDSVFASLIEKAERFQKILAEPAVEDPSL